MTLTPPVTAVVDEQQAASDARRRGDMVAARVHLERALAQAVADGDAERAAEARVGLAMSLAGAGDFPEALRQLEEASAGSAVVHARAQGQRAVVLQRLGRLDEAALQWRTALRTWRRLGDNDGVAKVLNNRGVLHAYRGDMRAAEVDLDRAGALYRSLPDRELEATEVVHNQGFVAARAGDVTRALRLFDRAAEEFERLGVRRPETLLDRCEALLAAQLATEALAVGLQALIELENQGRAADLAEAMVLVAEAALAAGRAGEAATMAGRAEEVFGAQGRDGWAARAGLTRVRAAVALGTGTDVVEVLALADRLAAEGWLETEAEVRLLAVRLYLDAGDSEGAARELDLVRGVRERGPGELRARAWMAEGLLCLTRGDRPAARRALLSALAVTGRRERRMGSTELRARAASARTETVNLGVRMAVEDGDAAAVLAWSERGRTSGTMLSSGSDSADSNLRRRLAELRDVGRQIEIATDDALPALRSREAALEDDIRHRAWRTQGRLRAARRPPSIRELAAALGDRALVELVNCDGVLHAVTVVDGETRLHVLGPEARVRAEVDALRFAMNRRARSARSGQTSDGLRAALVPTLDSGAARLDALVLGPLGAVLANRSLVVVPTGCLHGAPWGALPSCRGRSLAVCPSATGWLEGDAAAAGPVDGIGDAVLVAAAGIADGPTEVDRISSFYPGSVVLEGEKATIGRVLAAVEGADVVHVAAHGCFRWEKPLFSSVELTDGRLTVYDLERVGRAPRRVVLSSCETGLSGPDVLGIPSALLTLGTESLIASVVVVSGAEVQDLVVELHRYLAAGARAPDALARAQESVRGTDAFWAGLGFVCLGA